MAEPGTETPLDLSMFDDLKPATSHAVTVVPAETAVTDPRLVEVAKLSPDELAAAEQAAANGMSTCWNSSPSAPAWYMAKVTRVFARMMADRSRRICRDRSSGRCCMPAIGRWRW
jgi:hypothetical protein